MQFKVNLRNINVMEAESFQLEIENFKIVYFFIDKGDFNISLK